MTIHGFMIFQQGLSQYQNIAQTALGCQAHALSFSSN